MQPQQQIEKTKKAVCRSQNAVTMANKTGPWQVMSLLYCICIKLQWDSPRGVFHSIVPKDFGRQDFFLDFFFFFNCYLAVPRPTLGHSQGDSLINPMLITAFVHVRPESHQEPYSEVGSLSPAKRLVGFEPGTFQFRLQRLNPLGHSPQSGGWYKILDFTLLIQVTLQIKSNITLHPTKIE